MSLGVCPLPTERYPEVLLAHGGGGRLMHQLLEQVIYPALCAEGEAPSHDAATLALTGRAVMTTDSYVVRPRFFPGGDIGSLAVHGTVNDLAMAGATPRYLSVGLVLEEGLPMQELWQILCSLRRAADACGVRVVTGDTKVVDRGKGDGIYINTTGIGELAVGIDIRPARIQAGDCLLVNGDLGRHGMAVMLARDGLGLDSGIVSDSAPVHDQVQALLAAGIEAHCLRDLTRGGLASACHELALASGTCFELEETAIPVDSAVAAACEVLGLDPTYVACEGRFIAVVPETAVDDATVALADAGAQPAMIGRVLPAGQTPVQLRSRIGALRVLDLLSGEQLPRIC